MRRVVAARRRCCGSGVHRASQHERIDVFVDEFQTFLAESLELNAHAGGRSALGRITPHTMHYDTLRFDQTIPAWQRKTDAQPSTFGERIVGRNKNAATRNILDVVGKKLFGIAVFNQNPASGPLYASCAPESFSP